MGKRDRPASRAYSAQQLDELRGLIKILQSQLAFEGTDPSDSLEDSSIAEDIKRYQEQEEEMREVLTRTRSFWKGLVDQVAAVVDPQLVPVRENGIIITWVDARTGMQPWFS